VATTFGFAAAARNRHDHISTATPMGLQVAISFTSSLKTHLAFESYELRAILQFRGGHLISTGHPET
jgi:hypothetical protein